MPRINIEHGVEIDCGDLMMVGLSANMSTVVRQMAVRALRPIGSLAEYCRRYATTICNLLFTWDSIPALYCDRVRHEKPPEKIWRLLFINSSRSLETTARADF